jgi:hypothetical protein
MKKNGLTLFLVINEYLTAENMRKGGFAESLSVNSAASCSLR